MTAEYVDSPEARKGNFRFAGHTIRQQGIATKESEVLESLAEAGNSHVTHFTFSKLTGLRNSLGTSIVVYLGTYLAKIEETVPEEHTRPDDITATTDYGHRHGE